MTKAAKKKPVKARTRTKAAPKKAPAGKTRITLTVVETSQESIAPAPAGDAFYLNLDASCTLRETADLQFSLVAANGNPVVVNAGDVQRIDTAGLQLLVALAQRQKAAGRALEWKAASPELRQCSARLGLDEVLGLPAGDAA